MAAHGVGRAFASSGDRALYGLRVRSELPLDELPAWTADDREPDLLIRVGSVPRDIARPVYRNPFVTIGADGVVRYELPEAGACLIESAGSIVLEPHASGTLAGLRLLLDGGPLSVVCYRQGLLPMHASSLEIDGRVVLVAGSSGAGKSTIAAGLMRRGHTVLADDLSVLHTSPAAAPTVRPGFPRVKLWADALQRLGLSADGLDPVRQGLAKYNVRLAQAAGQAPRGVHVILVLTSVTRDDAAGVDWLAGVKAMAGLRTAVFRPRLADHLGLSGMLVTASRDVVRRVPVALLKFRKDPAALDGLLTGIESLARAAAASAV